ncbi:multidrug resistance protein [Canariomyces notabilis]|uniref:Multidrug resistance protein n=1 Tax=Canariomyces notabilis TaxID=2074819 RepID=A0AAN6TF53_9PEZI|nr:multidrug resistance protein [Canariomyces arenarius]
MHQDSTSPLPPLLPNDHHAHAHDSSQPSRRSNREAHPDFEKETTTLKPGNDLDEGAEAEVYTIFSVPEKRLIVALCGLSMLFSPLTANIYFPAMDQLQADLSAGNPQLINLTITAYLVLQGIAPALFGDIADLVGRRPSFLVMFAVYTVANIGLALQHSFAALLALRMLQSLGCSATVAVSYGAIADVATAADRGGMVGVAMIATNLGPVIAPVIGGGILTAAGWRWIFWFLAVCGVVVLGLMVLLLPETARNVVGNGDVVPEAWRRPLLTVLGAVNIPKAASYRGGMRIEKTQKRIPNPLRSVRLLFHKDASVVLLLSGVFYMVYYCLQASISVLFREIYHFKDDIIGACYLAIGCGVAVGGYLNGRLLDWKYKQTAKEIGHEINRTKSDDMDNFPIEKARLRLIVWMHLVHLAVLIGYGWMLESRVHVSGPLIVSFILGLLETCLVQTYNTLLVDIFQESPSAAAASGNIVRCALSAGGIAAMEPLMRSLGIGWYFTLLATVSVLLGLVGNEVLTRKGMQWRRARRGVAEPDRGAGGDT